MHVRHLILVAAVCIALAVTASAGAAGNSPEKRELPNSKSHYLLVLPKSYDKTRKYPLCVILHGSTMTAEGMQLALAPRLGEREYIFAYPQGTLPLADGFNWDAKDILVVSDTMHDVRKNFSVDAARILLMGFSAGASTGFYYIAKRPDFCTCFAAFGMGLPRGMPAHVLQRAGERIGHVYLMIGKDDPAHAEFFGWTKKTLEEAKFKVKAEEPENIGHTVSPEGLTSMFDYFESLTKKKTTPATSVKK